VWKPAAAAERRVERPETHSAPTILKIMNSKRGFTLIELLVVISIIAILAALLLPVFVRAKNQASQVSDLNNLKQQLTAMHLFAGDNNDVLPLPNWDNGNSDRPGWLYTADLTNAGPDEFKVETGLFWSTLRNKKLYLCPMDRPDSGRFGERPQQISSYAMNGAVVGYTNELQTPVKLSTLRADDCAFWETDERQPLYFNDGANFPAEAVSGRHREGGVQGTFGGSVNYIKLKTWYQDVADPNRNRLWCYPNSPNGR
jgi:prepilin-type N-terminal cleavage/methylation domain-containing protein